MKIGIDIGGSHIGIGVVDNLGKIIEKREIRILEENKKDIENFVEDFLIENIEELIIKYKIELIGISSAGAIKNGIILNSPNLGFNNYNIVEHIKNKINTNIPISIKNDAICAAIAEKEYGSLKNVKNALFLTLGTGIGGAVFYNNKLLKSNDTSFFEFGHIELKKNGIECRCGKKGCFERYASMKALKNNLRKNLNLNQTTSGKEIINIINENPNNEIIINTIEEYIENLSEGILILLNRFEIDSIGIGGSFVYYKDILLKKLEDKLLEKTNQKINIYVAILGNDAGMIGSIL